MKLRIVLALLAIAACAVLVRAVRAPEVFPAPGVVELRGYDSAYHARRALYSFARFPRVLVFDPYLAHPGGHRVPMPPLYDWALGGVARLFGDATITFERVAAWSSPLLSAATVLPVYLVGRCVGGRSLGLGSALLFALLPAGARRSWLGGADHHAAVALLGAVYLALGALRFGAPAGRRLAGMEAGLALVRAALALTWSGALAYLALGEGLLLGLALALSRADLLRAQAVGAAVAALFVAPWLLVLGPAHANPFAATSFSWLQPLALAAVAGWAAALAASERWWRSEPLAARLLGAAALALAIGGSALVAVPGLAAGIGEGLAFVAKADAWAATNPEQQPLYFASEPPDRVPLARRNYGWLAYLVPLLPFIALGRARLVEQRGPALWLAGWLLAWGALAISQVRYASDFAPAASVGFALLLGAVPRALGPRLPPRARASLAVVLGAALLWPGLERSYTSRLPAALAWLAGRPAAEPLAGSRLLSHFARAVRAATPETSGYLDPDARPEYGILAHPAQGHTLVYMARRATSASNFGPYLDEPKYSAVRRFYAASVEAEALDVARSLDARYVVTPARSRYRPRSFADRLHHHDGTAFGSWPVAEHFRLVVEGPALGSRPSPREAGRVPFKLFERVEGAILEAQAAPGAALTVRVEVETPRGRRFVYRARAAADPTGRIRLRVPYATRTDLPVRPTGPYRVRLGGETFRVAVSDAQVRQGAVVSVRPDAAASLVP